MLRVFIADDEAPARERLKELLGDLPIDIHGGGIDLIFPHHTDEIAQSEASTGKMFVNFWMHNAFLQMGGRKMAKSTGNIERVNYTYNLGAVTATDAVSVRTASTRSDVVMSSRSK